MIRNLKAMLLAALTVIALPALCASVALAHERFTAPEASAKAITTLKVDKDGIAKTAHSVFDITNVTHTESVSFTCEETTGTGTLEGFENTSNYFHTPGFKGNCSAAGQAAAVTNTGCDFIITASGTVHIVDDLPKECEHGKNPIDIAFAGCKVEVGKQTINGIKLHNLTDPRYDSWQQPRQLGHS